jgi:putative peptidoglycan lipid II flippase
MRLRQLFHREFTITEASLLMMVCFFASAVLGAVRQLLFNAQFGISVEANAYYAAFRLPDTLFAVIAGGALSNAMIPVLVSTERRDGVAAWARLINLVLTTLLAVLAGVILLLMLFTPLFVRYLLAPGFDIATSQLTSQLTRLMLVQPLILSGGSVAVAALNSRNQFLLPALSIICHNFAIISGILLAGRYPAIGIYGPTLGVVGGGILEVLVLLPGLVGQGRQIKPVWQPSDWHLREVVRLLIPNGLSIGVNYSGGIIDTAFASLTEQAVTLPALHNALLIGNLPVTLLGQTIGQSTFPRLAAQADQRAWPLMRKTLLQSSGIVIGLSLCALLAILLVGRRLIQILFEHGEYTAAAGDLTYRLLVIQSIALPAYVCTEVLTRGLIALRDTRTPLYTNIIQQVGRAVLLTFFIQPLGAPAIPLAFATSATIETLILAGVLAFKLRRLAQQSEQQVSTF